MVDTAVSLFLKESMIRLLNTIAELPKLIVSVVMYKLYGFPNSYGIYDEVKDTVVISENLCLQVFKNPYFLRNL